MSEAPRHDDGSFDPDALRAEARGRLRDRPLNLEEMDDEAVADLVHELEVHQVELEIQNEELRRAEAELAVARDRYRDLYEFAPVGYLTVDPESNVRDANLATSRLLGRERSGIVGQRLERIAHRDHRDTCYQLLRDAEDDGPVSAEFRLDHPDRTVWVAAEVTARPTSGAKEEVYRVTLTDITNRKRAEQRLEELNRSLDAKVAARTGQLERKSRHLRKLLTELSDAEDAERARLAEMVHDELQQELVGARYHLDLLAKRIDEPQKEPLAQAIRLIDEAVEQARGLSHTLSPPMLTQQGLRAAVKWQAEQMRRMHGLEVEITGDEDLGALPERVVLLVYKAVRELLLNVAKHAGVDEAGVSLRRAGDRLRVAVRDAGPGFNPQAVLGAKAPVGLGLLNIRERIEALGGQMHIESEPGNGTLTTLIVPVATGEEETETAPADRRPKPEPEPAESGLRPLRVLVVDDYRVMRQGIRMVISEAPAMEVVGEAAGGQGALKMVDELRPDAVVMDLAMPGMDGAETTRRIKEAHPEVRVIGLSMYAEDEGAEEMLEAGAETYLVKSDDPQRLLDALRAGR